jgi:hypothetical protein
MCEGMVDFGVEQGPDGSRIKQRPDQLEERIPSQHETDDRSHSRSHPAPREDAADQQGPKPQASR